jgi:hypothetical protein
MRVNLLRFVLLATCMGAAMTAALGDGAVGFALGLGIAASTSGRPRCRLVARPQS